MEHACCAVGEFVEGREADAFGIAVDGAPGEFAGNAGQWFAGEADGAGVEVVGGEFEIIHAKGCGDGGRAQDAGVVVVVVEADGIVGLLAVEFAAGFGVEHEDFGFVGALQDDGEYGLPGGLQACGARCAVEAGAVHDFGLGSVFHEGDAVDLVFVVGEGMALAGFEVVSVQVGESGVGGNVDEAFFGEGVADEAELEVPGAAFEQVLEGGFRVGERDLSQVGGVAVAVVLDAQDEGFCVGGELDAGPGEAVFAAVVAEYLPVCFWGGDVFGKVANVEAGIEGFGGAVACDVGELGVIGGELVGVDVVVVGGLFEFAGRGVEPVEIDALVVFFVGGDQVAGGGFVVVAAPVVAGGPVDIADGMSGVEVEFFTGFEGLDVELFSALGGFEVEDVLLFDVGLEVAEGEALDVGFEIDAAAAKFDDVGFLGGVGRVVGGCACGRWLQAFVVERGCGLECVGLGGAGAQGAGESESERRVENGFHGIRP